MVVGLRIYLLVMTSVSKTHLPDEIIERHDGSRNVQGWV